LGVLKRRRKKTPLGRAIDLSITVFLVAVMVYLAMDMLRSGRFTFLKFTPTAIYVGDCKVSPVPPDLVKAWGTLVRNSKKSSWQKIMEEGGGSPALVVEVTGQERRVTLSFFPLDGGGYFLAKMGREELAFQLDGWTYGKFVEALQQACRGGGRRGG